MAGVYYERQNGQAIKPSILCKELPGLTRRQVKFCRRNVDAMDSIRMGAKEAYDECQYQFHVSILPSKQASKQASDKN